MKRIIQALAIAAAAMTVAAIPAAAFTEAAGASTLTLGEVYHVGMFETVKATIDLPAGKILQTGVPEVELYSDAGCTMPLARMDQGYGSLRYDPQAEPITVQVYSYEVPAAGTYYAYTQLSPLSSSYFTFTNPNTATIELTRITPAAGSTISAAVNSSGTGEVVLSFNVPVSFGKAYLKIGSATTAKVNGGDPKTELTVKIGQLMKDAYKAGLFDAKGGTAFTVVIDGLKSYTGVTYGTDGRLEINYTAARKSLELVSTNIVEGREFLSYYPKGSPDAIFTMTFDGPVATDGPFAPYADFGIGQLEYEGKYVYEQIIPTVEGSTLTFDLSGVNRHPATAAAGVADGSDYSFKVCNVFDTSHQPAQGLTDANIGSYPFTFKYKVVEEQTVDSDFTPPTGSDLADCATLTVWHNNAHVIESFDGLLFAYDDGDSQLIPADQLVNTSTEADEVEYRVEVPQKARTAPVTVLLANVLSFDGYQKSIKAAYNKFVVTFCTPFSEGATMLEIPYDRWMADESNDPADKLIQIRTNYAQKYPEMYVWFDVVDVTTGNSLRSSDMERLPDGHYAGAWFAEPTTLVGGHTYEARFSAWPTAEDYYYNKATACLGTHVVTFYGSGEGFAYSPVQFVSIDPDPANGPITPAQNEFIVTYDGLVKLVPELTAYALGMGAGTVQVPFEAVDADPENDGFSSVWKLTVSPSAMTGTGISLTVAAYDQNGAPVAGDMMTYSDQDYKSFDYTIYDNSGYLELSTTPADGSAVDAISAMTFSCAMPIGFNWNCAEPIEIFGKLGAVHTVVRSEGPESEIAIQTVDAATEMTVAVLTLDEPISEPGTYMINVPEAYFMLGSQFDTNYNSAMQITLTVGGSATTFPMTVDPFDGDQLQSLSKIVISTAAAIYSDCPDYYMTLTTPTFENIGWSYYDYTSGADNIRVLRDGQGQNAPVVGYEFLLGQDYTAPGTYTLTIPEKFFELGGEFNPAMTLTYTIGGSEANFSFVPQQGQTVKDVSSILVRISGAELNPACADEAPLNNPISFQNFVPLELWTSKSDKIEKAAGGFLFRFANAEKYTTPGEYIFGLPEGFFILDGGAQSRGAYLTFYVEGTGKVDRIEITVTPGADSTDDGFDCIEFQSESGLIPSYRTDSYVRLDNVDTGENVFDLGPIFFTSFVPWPEGCYLNDTTARISLAEPLSRTAASYRLTIPAKFFKDFYDNLNEEIVVTYAKLGTEGVAAVTADADGMYTVYDAFGRLVLRTDRAADLIRLAPGFYIINGHKYILR